MDTTNTTEAPAKTGADLSNLRYRPFLIINTIRRPAKGVNTSKKGWANDDNNWAIFESPFVADRVSSRVMNEATVIVDVMRGVCIKNRFDNVENDEIAHHYLDKYKEQVKQSMDVWLSKMAQKMAAEPHFARPQATETTETTPPAAE